MNAKPGRPRRPRAQPRGARLHSLAADYRRLLRQRKKALAQLESEGFTVPSYRGGKKPNPLLAIIRDLDAQLWKLRALLAEQQQKPPQPPGPYFPELADDPMEALIDDQGR